MIGFEYNGTKYWYDKNLQGDIVGIRNASGTLVAQYEYDAWGKHIRITDGSGNDVSDNPNHIANINPFRYRGYYFDVETGWYYLNARYYDPNVGRFISPDCYVSTGQGLLGHNMFAYCNNNPVMFVDPNGNIVKYEYDALMRLVKKTSYSGDTAMGIISYEYGANSGSNLFSTDDFKPTRITNSRGYITEKEYDGLYRLIKSDEEYAKQGVKAN